MRVLPIVSLLLVASASSHAMAAGDAPEPAAAPGGAVVSAQPKGVSTSEANAAVSEVQALVDAKRFKEATTKARAFVTKDTGNAQMYNLLGFALRQQKQWVDSVAAYQEALKLRPDYVQAKEYLAVAYLGMGETKAAKALHDELKTTHPALAKAVATEAKRLKVKW
ncbi:MAG: tetratricopeptide repeat protein [Silvanigrellales bacterium]|nr:tetratricopeptide repeat protein [Silvanigrellales bacterium]